jgi:uncharacterized BrkB/YihY/UPF0761 family membrane protein
MDRTLSGDSIAGVILFMLWLYLTGLVLLLGGEVNSETEHAAAVRGAVTAKAKGEKARCRHRGGGVELSPESAAILDSTDTS